MSRTHDPPCPLSLRSEDQQPPAAKFSTEFRAGLVNRAADPIGSRNQPQEGARLRPGREDLSIQKELALVRVYRDHCFLSVVAIVKEKGEITIVLLNAVHKAHVAAAFATLLAEKGQDIPHSDIKD